MDLPVVGRPGGERAGPGVTGRVLADRDVEAVAGRAAGLRWVRRQVAAVGGNDDPVTLIARNLGPGERRLRGNARRAAGRTAERRGRQPRDRRLCGEAVLS